MSTTDKSQRDPSLECAYSQCEEFGRKWEMRVVDGTAYCSTACETRSEGREALARFIYDHALCTTCFRQLKDIEPPKPDFEFTENGHGWTLDGDGEPTLEYYNQDVSRSAATGWQSLTGNATKGERSREDRVITGTICDRCGNTDHTHHNTTLATRAAIGRLVALFDDVDSVVIDEHQLHREYETTRDLELAVGRALE